MDPQAGAKSKLKGAPTLDRRMRVPLALLAPVAILLVAHWFDGQVLRDFQRQMSATFDARPLAWVMPVGYLIAAAGVLAVAFLARWSRSLLVGIAYALVGGFLTFLMTLTWVLAAGVNDTPPVLPEPVALFVSNAYWWAADGVTGAVFVIGAGMLLAGIGAIAMAVRRRAAGGMPPVDRPGDPTG